jgi:hypothetical protein
MLSRGCEGNGAQFLRAEDAFPPSDGKRGLPLPQGEEDAKRQVRAKDWVWEKNELRVFALPRIQTV